MAEKRVLIVQGSGFGVLREMLARHLTEAGDAGRIKRRAPPPPPADSAPDLLDIVCPLGKQAFRTKAEARAVRAHTSRRRNFQRTSSSTFRCDFCGYIHLGNRRK